MSTELQEDIETAQKIITTGKREDGFGFSSVSGIYRGTNEVISAKGYKDLITGRERILSIIASGDQILNAILLGSKDIEGFDISRFPQYYLKLKIAAIKALGRDEFLRFFYGGEEVELFNRDVYNKIHPFMDSDAQKFWSTIFGQFSNKQILCSPLIKRDKYSERIGEVLYKNIYVHEGQYEILKEKIGDITLRLHVANLMNLDTRGMKKFNLVNLSNVMNHVLFNKGDYLQFKHIIESMPLTSDGVVLNYNIEYYTALEGNGMFEILGDNFRPVDLDDPLLKERNEPDWLYVYKKKWGKNGTNGR